MDSPNISRRDILKIGGLVAAGTALTACTLKDDLLSVFINPNLQTDTQTSLPTTQIPVEKMQSKELSSSPSPKPEFNDITTENSVILHTLRRMQFGITPQMIQHAQSIGLMNYIDEQLQMQNLETNSTEEKINNLSIMKQSKEDLLKDENQGRIVREFVLSTIFRQVTNPYQIYEMMVDFWTNHFNIFLLDGFAKILKIYDDREVIRPNALKTFPDLLQASAHSPAMLYYLDQARSSRNSPNENYARELLELHTVGVDSSYTQGDIETLARELTGWSIVGPRDAKTMNLELGDFYFRSKAHDNKEKNIMLRYFLEFPELKRAYWLKERICSLYKIKNRRKARHKFKIIKYELLNSRELDLIELGNTLSRWEEKILNYFSCRITNAYTEGIHTKCKLIKRKSYGFRNVETYVRKLILGLVPLILIYSIHTF